MRKLGKIFIFAASLLACMFHSTIMRAEPISFSDLLNRPAPVASKHLAYGDDPDQFGELWLPEGTGPHPVIVMIHGGCWQDSLPGVVLMSYIAEDMRRSGFAVWNIEYRRLGHAGGGYPGTFLDIAAGMDYLRKISPVYNLDISNLTVIGHSAGGHLGLWAAARAHIKSTSTLYRANPLQVRRVITLSGINDLHAYRDKGPSACGGPDTIDQLVDAARRPDPYVDTSPAAMLPLKVKQVIISGALDPIVPSQFGNDYSQLAKAAGDQVKYLEIKDAGHFELIDPQSAAWQQIKKELVAKP